MTDPGSQNSRGVRERMIGSAIVQLAKHGIQGASFAEILAHAKAPRGSVYHYFPEGKQQLIAAALNYMGSDGLAVLNLAEGASVGAIVGEFMAMWRSLLERSHFTAGCSIAGVAVTSDTPDLLERAAQVFRLWRDHLAALLTAAGLSSTDAEGFATMLIAAAEGAVVLARAERRLEPLDVVQAQLEQLGWILTPQPQ